MEWPENRSRVLALAALAFAVGLAIRLPWLFSVPVFSVEWGEILIGYQIAFAHLHPWTNYAHDIGPLYNYLIAGTFRLFGLNLYIPRILMLVFGATTVGLGFLIGREAGGIRVGLLAALMLAVSGASVIDSHMAFSNGLTPLFVALAGLFSLYGDKRHPVWLIPAGFIWALALQTDSSVLAVLIPLFFYLLLTAPKRNRIPQTALALGAFFFGYLNMIIYNIETHMGSLQWILQKKGYAVSQSHGIVQVGVHYIFEALEWGQTLGTAFNAKNAIALDAWAGVIILSWLGLFFLGVRKTWLGKKNPLLLVLTLGPLALIPVFNKAYNYPLAARYLVPMLPFAYAMISEASLDLLKKRFKGPRRARLATFLFVFLVAATSLTELFAYEGTQVQAAQTNRQGFALAAAAQSMATSSTVVLFDSTGSYARYFPAMLRSGGLTVTLMGDPWSHKEKGVFSYNQWKAALRRPQNPLLAVLTPRDYQTLLPLMPKGTRKEVLPGHGGGYILVTIPASP